MGLNISPADSQLEVDAEALIDLLDLLDGPLVAREGLETLDVGEELGEELPRGAVAPVAEGRELVAAGDEAEAEEDPDFDPDRMTIVVDQSHFERVLEISSKFRDYIQSIRREDEGKRAAARNDRNDNWGASSDGKQSIN